MLWNRNHQVYEHGMDRRYLEVALLDHACDLRGRRSAVLAGERVEGVHHGAEVSQPRTCSGGVGMGKKTSRRCCTGVGCARWRPDCRVAAAEKRIGAGGIEVAPSAASLFPDPGAYSFRVGISRTKGRTPWWRSWDVSVHRTIFRFAFTAGRPRSLLAAVGTATTHD
jgi:hypothetical protein